MTRLSLLVFTAASLAGAQGDTLRARPQTGSIDGLVTDSALAPMDDVTVSVIGTSIKVVTGANGLFRILSLPAGKHRVLARRIGREPALADVDVAVGEQTRLVFVLEPLVTALPTARVEGEAPRSAKLKEFEERRLAGFGEFMTAEQIAKRNVVSASDLLVGFKNVVVSIGTFGSSAVSRRNPMNMRCPMSVVVDGIPRGTNLNEIPSPKELAGIEMYHGPATIPLQYKRWSGAGFCGLILAWTKDGTRPK